MVSGIDLEIEVRDLFDKMGFYVVWTQGKEFNINRDSIQIDIFCVCKNICLLIETTDEKHGSGSKIDRFSEQCRKVLVDDNLRKYLEYLNTLPDFSIDTTKFNDPNMKYRRLFIGTGFKLQLIKERGNNADPKIYSWDKDLFEYFDLMTSSIMEFTKYELFGFLDITPEMIEGEISTPRHVEAIKLVSSELRYEIYTFTILVKDLLELGKIMRRDGWETDSFQRFIKTKKLEKIRKYLLQEQSFFPNNIIVSLPNDTTFQPLIDGNDRLGKLIIPRRYGSLTIIDGQHRLLGYTQCNVSRYTHIKGPDLSKIKSDDAKIRGYINNHRLIVTGIKFTSERESKDRARIFVEINDNQTRIKKELIFILSWEILGSRYPEAFASCIIERLNSEKLFKDKFQMKEFQKNKIPITSIIRYALRYLFDTNKGELYKIAPDWIKEEYQKDNFEPFIKHCLSLLIQYFKQVKDVFSPDNNDDSSWNDITKENSMLMSVTSLAAFIRLFRHFFYLNNVWNTDIFFESHNVREGTSQKPRIFLKKNEVRSVLDTISIIKFERGIFDYSSSQWGKLEAFMIQRIRKKKKYSGFGKIDLLSSKYALEYGLS